MYLEVTWRIEYNLLENSRKMAFLEKTQFSWFFGARERARTDMVMLKINSLILVE